MSSSDQKISVLDLASQLGRRKQTVFKILKRLGIETTKQRSSDSRGQLIAYVTVEESNLVAAQLRLNSSGDAEIGAEALPDEQGVSYLLLLEPDHDSGRFKVGFAVSLHDRLRQLRCSAPFAKVVDTWPCKKLWEKTAIDCITAGCERLHTEIFRTENIGGKETVQRFLWPDARAAHRL